MGYDKGIYDKGEVRNLREGKHQIKEENREKRPNKLKILFTCIILIGIAVAGGLYLRNMPMTKKDDKPETKANVENKEDSQVIEKAEKLINSKSPIIWYYNMENVKVPIEEGTLFRDHIKIAISRGNITVFTKDGKDFKEEYSEDEELSEGEYVIKVEAEDGSSCERSFIVDTVPPKVTGIRNKKTYKEVVTIKLEDLDDIKEATLTKGKTEINLKEESEEQSDGTFYYKVKQNGEYILKAKDVHGIEIKRTFKVEIK